MNSVFAIAMAAAGLECAVHDIGVTVAETEPDPVKAIIGQIAENPPAVEDLADFVGNLRVAKYDAMVPEPLLRRLWAKANAESAAHLQAQAMTLLES